MKKRIIATMLASLMMVSGLIGCGSNSEASKDTAEGKVLKIAAFEGGYGKVYWDKLKENFEKSHEGVTVELTVALSDLTGVLDKKVPGENVTVREKILPGFLDTSATNPYGDGKTYLAPLFYSPTGLFYDKHLFEEKG